MFRTPANRSASTYLGLFRCGGWLFRQFYPAPFYYLLWVLWKPTTNGNVDLKSISFVLLFELASFLLNKKARKRDGNYQCMLECQVKVGSCECEIFFLLNVHVIITIIIYQHIQQFKVWRSNGPLKKTIVAMVQICIYRHSLPVFQVLSVFCGPPNVTEHVIRVETKVMACYMYVHTCLCHIYNYMFRCEADQMKLKSFSVFLSY